MLNGVFWRTRCGLPWRDLPPQYGHWKTVYKRHRRWSGDGTWIKILDELRRDADLHEGPDWAVAVEAAVSVRTSTPRAPGANCPPTSPRRSSRPPRSTQGAGSNNKKSDGRPGREALGLCVPRTVTRSMTSAWRSADRGPCSGAPLLVRHDRSLWSSDSRN